MELNIKGNVLRDVPMKRYTSMRVGGKAPFLIYPQDEENLIKAIKILKEMGVEFRYLGNGTNIIVHDRGIKEAVISLKRIKNLSYKKEGGKILVEVSGGLSLKRLLTENERRGFAGLERLFSIPGTVGGAIKMNAGSFGLSISERLLKYSIIDEEGEKIEILKEKHQFDYRRSILKKKDCLFKATFVLEEKDRELIRKEMRWVLEEREKRHPIGYPSAGSIFKNPSDKPAWRYIEEAGLKGFRIGDACISEKHANFIINAGNAKAEEIKRLVDEIKRIVYEKTGTFLEEEIEFWGFDE